MMNDNLTRLRRATGQRLASIEKIAEDLEVSPNEIIHADEVAMRGLIHTGIAYNLSNELKNKEKPVNNFMTSPNTPEYDNRFQHGALFMAGIMAALMIIAAVIYG